jgi:predicted RNase H-like HicB family nuclease
MDTLKEHPAVTKPFDAGIWAEAGQLVARYHLVLHAVTDGFSGTIVELPTVIARGKTPAECFEATRTSAQAAAATLMELGQKPPAPRGRERRDEQLNIRVTGEEKRSLEYAANENGYRNVSEFVRAVALQSIGTASVTGS